MLWQVRIQKQQTAASARHRELMEMKQREIEALQRSKRTQDRAVSDLQVHVLLAWLAVVSHRPLSGWVSSATLQPHNTSSLLFVLND